MKYLQLQPASKTKSREFCAAFSLYAPIELGRSYLNSLQFLCYLACQGDERVYSTRKASRFGITSSCLHPTRATALSREFLAYFFLPV